MSRHRAWIRCALVLTALGLAGTARAQVSLVDLKSGQSSGSATVSAANVTAATNHLYLAAICPKPFKNVDSVSGLGLTWAPVNSSPATQCSGKSETSVSIWWAIGSPTGSGAVTANLASSATNAVIIVSRYSGVDTGDPIGNAVSANTNGVAGGCTGGTNSSAYSMSLATTVPGDVVFCAAARRNKNHSPGAGYTERLEVSAGSGNTLNGLAVQDRTFSTPSTVVANGSFTSNPNGGSPASIDWAAAAVEIHAAVHPFLYFRAADLAALRADTTSGVRGDIYQAIKAAAEDQTDPWRGWLFHTPTDPGEVEGEYAHFTRKMVSLAFMYVLNPTLTNYRDKALEFADKLIEILPTHAPGGWGGTNACVPDTCRPYDFRIDAVPYCIRSMATVYDWLYDEIPNTPPPGKQYRSKEQYRSAIDAERQRLREAIDQQYTDHWGNWWPNSWMQNHSTVAYTGYAIATWGLDGDLLANEVDPDDRDLANDAMVRIRAFNDLMTPDGVWQEGMHYSLGILEWSHAFHVQQTVQGVDNWPHAYFDAYADWVVANVLDNVSRSVLIRRGDLGGNDPPVTVIPQYNLVGNRIGAGPLARAHIGAAKAQNPAQKAKLAWAAEQFKAQDTHPQWVKTGRITNVFNVLDHVIEYFVYTPVTAVPPTARRYSFPDRHNYIWTNGHTVNDAKVGSAGGGYAGDTAIAVLPDYPWKAVSPTFPHSPQLNAGHSHEDAGQYYLRKGHTELATEYGGTNNFLSPGPYHNILLIDPGYNPPNSGIPALTLNPTQCGQYKGPDAGTDATLDPTRATTPHDRWLGPSPDQVRADYLVHNLSPRYQYPLDESTPPTGQILTRYDRRMLWLRDVPPLGPVLFVHDEVEAGSPHVYEWRNHSPVPQGGTVAQSNAPATLPVWRVDCPDGLSLALAVAVPTFEEGQPPQGAPFTVSAHQHAPADPPADGVPPNGPNPPWFVRVANTALVANTHMGFMMFPVSTSAWNAIWPDDPPPGVSAANFNAQNRPAVVSFGWATPGFGHALNFMDDGAESANGLVVDGAPHVSAAYVSLRDANATAAKAYLFWGTKAFDFDGNRNYIVLSDPGKLADIMAETDDAGRLDIYVTAHNQGAVTTLLHQALFYEHPTSTGYITSVHVDGVNVDTEVPRRFNWMHEPVGGKIHVRLLAVGGGGGGGGGEIDGVKPPETPLRTMLAPPVETGRGGPFTLRYSIAENGVPVRIGIYDLMGRLVRDFDEGIRGAGEYEVTWQGDDVGRRRVAPGLYVIRLVAGSTTASRKVMIWRP